MALRFLFFASFALLFLGAGAPTIRAKGACIDPNGGLCHSGGGSSNGGASAGADGGASIDPNGQ